MKDIEREDQQMQAEILERIDTLHAALVRRRRGWVGGVSLVAVVASVWLWPSGSNYLTEPQPVIVAQQENVHVDRMSANTKIVSRKDRIVNLEQTSHSDIHTLELTSEAEEEPQIIAEEQIQQSVEVEEVQALPLVKEPQLYAAVFESDEPSEPESDETAVCVFQASKRSGGLRLHFGSVADPNTEGGNFSIRVK